MKVIINDVEYVPLVDVPKDGGHLAALEVRFDSDAGKNLSVRDYLHKLLWTLLNKGEDFSGKRPYGNSGWDRDLYVPLIAAGFIRGELTEDGYIEDVDDEQAAKFVFELISVMCYGKK